MAHIYKYAILKGIPDPQRGERVNVGVIVFKSNAIDVRFPGVTKLGAISLGEWSTYAADVTERMKSLYEPGEEPASFLSNYSVLERVIQFSDVAWFSAHSESEYEERVSELINLFVRKPHKERAARGSAINTEIAANFRSAHVLAASDETIDDHKVVQNYYVSKEELLKADFVHKNGLLHVTTTLDLRQRANIKNTTYKGMVLVKTRERWGDGARRYAVYAAAPGEDQYDPHLRLMRDYAHSTFNWLVPKERNAYRKLILDSISAGHTPF